MWKVLIPFEDVLSPSIPVILILVALVPFVTQLAIRYASVPTTRLATPSVCVKNLQCRLSYANPDLVAIMLTVMLQIIAKNAIAAQAI